MELGPNREVDTTPPAPGELERVRAFLSLHDHAPGSSDAVAPTPDTVRWWLVDRQLLAPHEEVRIEELAWAIDVQEALRALVRENMGVRADTDLLARVDSATTEVGLVPSFGLEALVPTAGGVRGAVGRILAIAFLARLDGTWSRFKECASPDCRAVFYDRSKNRSGKWCVMAECGNRAKVRAFRERERTHP